MEQNHANKVTRQDYEAADAELDRQYEADAARRFGDVVVNKMLGRGGDERSSSQKIAEATAPSFNMFFKREDFAEDAPANGEQSANLREQTAREKMMELRRNNFLSSAREYLNLQKEEINTQLMIRVAGETGRAGGLGADAQHNNVTVKLHEELENIHERQESLEYQSPEAYTTKHAYEFKDYVQAIKRGENATTPYVAAHLQRLEHNMAQGRPTFIHGHLGSGKTEMAIMAAKHSAINEAAYSQGFADLKSYASEHPEMGEAEARSEFGRFYRRNQRIFEKGLRDSDDEAVERFAPLVISGSKDLTSQDLYADKTLKLTKFNGKPLLEHKEDLDALIKQWEDEHRDELDALDKDAREKMQREHANEILELYKLKNQAFGTEVETVKQAVYRGVEEGRPVIIDEINAIPTAVLISMNDILQRRPGEAATSPAPAPSRCKMASPSP